jgi:hypothetical protein
MKGILFAGPATERHNPLQFGISEESRKPPNASGREARRLTAICSLVALALVLILFHSENQGFFSSHSWWEDVFFELRHSGEANELRREATFGVPTRSVFSKKSGTTSASSRSVRSSQRARIFMFGSRLPFHCSNWLNIIIATVSPTTCERDQRPRLPNARRKRRLSGEFSDRWREYWRHFRTGDRLELKRGAPKATAQRLEPEMGVIIVSADRTFAVLIHHNSD